MIRRKTPIKKSRAPIKKISDKQVARLERYRPVRVSFLQENPECAIQRPGCLGVSTNVHHGKGKIGELLYDTRYMVPCCSGPCHRWAEDHPEEAYEKGVSFKRNSIN